MGWSPDGEHIVFASSRMGFKDEGIYTDAPQPYGELFVMRYDGSRRRAAHRQPVGRRHAGVAIGDGDRGQVGWAGAKRSQDRWLTSLIGGRLGTFGGSDRLR